jgi:hypothetical protein
MKRQEPRRSLSPERSNVMAEPGGEGGQNALAEFHFIKKIIWELSCSKEGSFFFIKSSCLFEF